MVTVIKFCDFFCLKPLKNISEIFKFADETHVLRNEQIRLSTIINWQFTLRS